MSDEKIKIFYNLPGIIEPVMKEYPIDLSRIEEDGINVIPLDQGNIKEIRITNNSIKDLINIRIQKNTLEGFFFG